MKLAILLFVILISIVCLKPAIVASQTTATPAGANNTKTSSTPPKTGDDNNFARDLRMLLKELTNADQAVERVVGRIEEEIDARSAPVTEGLWITLLLTLALVVLGVLPTVGYLLYVHINASDSDHKQAPPSPIRPNIRSKSGERRSGSRNKNDRRQPPVFVTEPQEAHAGLSNAFNMGPPSVAVPKLPRMNVRAPNQAKLPTVPGRPFR